MRSILWVALLFLGCRNPSPEPLTPTPRSPRGGEAGVLLELEKPGFFFVERVKDRLFLGLTYQRQNVDSEESPTPRPAWTFTDADLSEPEVISSSYSIAVTRKIVKLPADLAALEGRRVAVYQGKAKLCETTVTRVLALNQFQVREPADYGMPSTEMPEEPPGAAPKAPAMKPKFPEIFRDSTFSVAAELAPCPGFKAPGYAALWARSLALKAPDFWPVDTAADWQQSITSWLEQQEAWREILAFKEDGSSEKPMVRFNGWRRDPAHGVVELTASIGDPGVRHFFVLSWNGREFTSVQASGYQGDVAFVADLDDDGHPEFVFSWAGSGLDRQLIRLEDGKWKVLGAASIVNQTPEAN